MEINEFPNLSSDGELFSCLNQEYFSSPPSPLPRTPCELTASIEDLNLTQAQAFKESNILLTKEASHFKYLYQGSQSQLHETQNKLHETQNKLQKALEEIKLLRKQLEEQSLSSPDVSFSRPPNYRKELPITVPTKKQKVNRPPLPSSLKKEKFINPMTPTSIANPDISSLFSSSFNFDLSKDEIIKEECIFDGHYSIVPTLPPMSSDSELMDRALAFINSFPLPEKKPCSKGQFCKDHTLSHSENFIHPVLLCTAEKCDSQEPSHTIRFSHPLHLQEEFLPTTPTTTLSLPMVTSPSPSSPDSMIVSPGERSVELPVTLSTSIPKRKQPKKSTTQKKKNTTKNVKKEENCPYCGIKLSRGGFVLKRHISTQHPEKASIEQIKRFPCEECGQVFNTKAAMKRHFQIHSLEKPWKCNFCVKAYSDHVNLKRHLAWHEGTTFQQQKKSVVKG